MTDRKYDIKMLKDIPQLDVALALKKSPDENALFENAFNIAGLADSFIKKYDDEGIVAKHRDFLEDAEQLKESLEKLYAATTIWDVDELIKAYKSGKRELIDEKFDQVKISCELLVNRINDSEYDENGNLKNPSKLGKPEFEDEELETQPECGKTVSGNFVALDQIKKIADLVCKFEYDDASEIAKKISTVFYNEHFNIEVKKLLWVMRMGEFEKAEASAERLVEMAEQHNKAVSENAEKVKPRVLVVDDVIDVLLTVKGILFDYCHVCTVTNYLSALRFLENCHADLILLDIELHEVNGFELLKKIREFTKYKNTPVMFLTGNVSKETILQAIDAGVSDYLRKPIDAKLLVSRVRKHLKV